MTTSKHSETETAPRYIRQQFSTRDNLRAAIAKLVNATFEARDPQWWGCTRRARASDPKRFDSWESNQLGMETQLDIAVPSH